MIRCCVVPHPPLIIPGVGKGEEIPDTRAAYKKIAAGIKEYRPDTVIYITPHNVMYQDYFHISPGGAAAGDMGEFRARQIRFSVEYDEELAKGIAACAEEAGLPAGFLGERDPKLDHGTMVPLYFFGSKRIVRLSLSGLPLISHYRYGMCIRRAAEKLSRRIYIVASGDMSHKLKDDGPYGFAPEGPVHDAFVAGCLGWPESAECIQPAPAAAGMQPDSSLRSESGDAAPAPASDPSASSPNASQPAAVSASGTSASSPNASQPAAPSPDFRKLMTIDPALCEGAAECGLRSIVIMAGALDGLDVAGRALSYEGPFGVGYLTADFTAFGEAPSLLPLIIEDKEASRKEMLAREDAWVRLAREGVEHYVKKGKQKSVPEGLPPELADEKAGVFVSIKKDGALRGCIGTIMPVKRSVAEEILANGVSAAAYDSRFDPITEDELDSLSYSVDVLSPPESISGPEELDLKRYGVIVTKGQKRGLLLPDLEGVDTIEEQISIACRKGGIGERERYDLERFEVIRHKP